MGHYTGCNRIMDMVQSYRNPVSVVRSGLADHTDYLGNLRDNRGDTKSGQATEDKNHDQ